MIDDQQMQTGEPDYSGDAVSLGANPNLPDLRKLREWHTECARWRMTWLPEAERLEGQVHAYQWTQDEISELDRQGRKAIKSPHIAKVIWSMVGWRSQNKYEIKYLPRGASDKAIAEAKTSVAKYVWDQNSAEYVMGDACISQYVGPMGWVFVGVDYTDPSRDPIVIDDVPWREMSWDFRARKSDLSDAKYVCRERWVSLDDAKQLYPEHADALDQWVTTRASGDQGVNEYGMAYTEQRAGDPVGPVSSWPTDRYLYAARKEIRLVEMWYRCKEKGHYIQLPDGRNVVFDPRSADHQYALMEGATVRPGTINKVYTATFTGDLLLEHMPSPYDHGMFPYVPVWGLVDQKGIPYGITRLIEDEQLVINWSTSKLLWIAASRQAKVAPGEDVEEIAENLAKPDGIMQEKTPGGITILDPSDMTSINSNLLQNALNNMREIAGSTEEMRGQASNAKSGRAILARQDAALRQQGRFLDNEQRALVMIGQILGSLMDQVYSTEKILRITEANGKDAQVAVNVTDPFRREQLEASGLKVYGPITQGEYDCVVSTAPLSTTQREAQFDNLTQMMSGLDPQVRVALLDLWVDAGEWSNKDEIKQRIQQVQQQMMGPPPPSPEAQQAMQMQQQMAMAQGQAQVEKDQAQAQKYKADAFKAVTDAQGTRHEQMAAYMMQANPMDESPQHEAMPGDYAEDQSEGYGM